MTPPPDPRANRRVLRDYASVALMVLGNALLLAAAIWWDAKAGLAVGAAQIVALGVLLGLDDEPAEEQP